MLPLDPLPNLQLELLRPGESLGLPGPRPAPRPFLGPPGSPTAVAATHRERHQGRPAPHRHPDTRTLPESQHPLVP